MHSLISKEEDKQIIYKCIYRCIIYMDEIVRKIKNKTEEMSNETVSKEKKK